MKSIFLDTGIFELFFSGNQTIKKIFNQIKNQTIKAFTLELNLCANIYKTCEKLGNNTGQISKTSLRKSKIKICHIK